MIPATNSAVLKASEAIYLCVYRGTPNDYVLHAGDNARRSMPAVGYPGRLRMESSRHIAPGARLCCRDNNICMQADM